MNRKQRRALTKRKQPIRANHDMTIQLAKARDLKTLAHRVESDRQAQRCLWLAVVSMNDAFGSGSREKHCSRGGENMRKIEELHAYMNPSGYGVTLRIDGKEFSGQAKWGDSALDANREFMGAMLEEYPDMVKRYWEYADIDRVTEQVWKLLCALQELQRAGM